MENKSEDRKDASLGVIASFLFTGLGNIYAGETEKGVILLIVYIILAGLSAATGIMLVLFIPYWIWGMFNAASAVDKYNQRIANKLALEFDAKKKIDEEKNIFVSADFLIKKFNQFYMMHESKVITESEFTDKKGKLISELAIKKIYGDKDDFLSELIPIIQRKIITDAELDEIKRLIT